MGDINIRQQHTLSEDEAKKRSEQLAKQMEEQLGFRWHWVGSTIKFEAPSGIAKGSTGKLNLGASEVHMEFELPLMLRMMKGLIGWKMSSQVETIFTKS